MKKIKLKTRISIHETELIVKEVIKTNILSFMFFCYKQELNKEDLSENVLMAIKEQYKDRKVIDLIYEEKCVLIKFDLLYWM